MKHYASMQKLLSQDRAARHYFESLPDFVQEQIQSRAGSVNSMASLQDYAENLLRGDD